MFQQQLLQQQTTSQAHLMKLQHQHEQQALIQAQAAQLQQLQQAQLHAQMNLQTDLVTEGQAASEAQDAAMLQQLSGLSIPDEGAATSLPAAPQYGLPLPTPANGLPGATLPGATLPGAGTPLPGATLPGATLPTANLPGRLPGFDMPQPSGVRFPH